LLQIDESFAGRDVNLPAGETCELRLPENRTAGFRWRLVGSLPTQVTSEEDSYIAPTSPSPPGTPGVHVWKLKATNEGSVKIEFEYARSWESTDKAPRKFAVTIRVAG
jgi:predicted secreted protein